MRLLLYTHIFLWWHGDDRRLERAARDEIRAAEAVIVSAASAWEVAIKVATGRLRLDEAFEQSVDVNGFDKLGVDFRHAAAAAALPRLHGDPFDRMLIAQALVEGLTLVTHDARLTAYNAPLLLA